MSEPKKPVTDTFGRKPNNGYKPTTGKAPAPIPKPPGGAGGGSNTSK